MDTKTLRGFCDACLPEQWTPLEAGSKSDVYDGKAIIVQGHQMDVNAIVAFGNAMPELLDTIERLTKERDEARAEVERLKSKLSVIGGGRQRCKLCGVILEDGRKEFCSTCCAQ